jgi:hypothetical protein
MVLFLVVMSTRLLSISKAIDAEEGRKRQRERDITEILERFSRAAADFDGIRVDRLRQVIEFGDRARFELNKSTLTDGQEQTLRAFVPKVLVLADGDLGRRILKRIVVEGFTDTSGTYLRNLSLSLERSERVLCALFRPPTASERPLTDDERRQIRDLFMVGGYSFNAARATAEESRRVEMRLEFLSLDEKRATGAGVDSELGVCEL